MRILIIGPSWVGDTVISQSLLGIISSHYDSVDIDVLAPRWTLDIYKRMKQVSDVFLLPFKHGDFKFNQRVDFGRRLKSKGYDQAIVLPNSLKSSFIPFFAKIPRRTGWIGEMRYFFINDIRKLNKLNYPRMVDRFVALAASKDEELPHKIPYPSLVIDRKNIDTFSSRYGLRSHTPTITLCPGAEFGPSKRWPPSYFSKIADNFISKDWQVLLLGSKNDVLSSKEVEYEMTKKNPELFFNLTGMTSLEDAIDILATSSVVLTNDSGLMHISAAVRTPLVALFGPSSPEFTPPLAEKKIVLRKEKGYIKKRVGSLPGGYHKSLIEIKPQEAIEALERIKT